MFNTRFCVMQLAALLMCVQALPAVADDADVTLVLRRGASRTVREVRAAAHAGGLSLSIPCADLDDVDAVEVLPSFARAKTGEPGYFAMANGMLGEFSQSNGSYKVSSPPMSFWGMKTPRRTFVCEVKGMSLSHSVRVDASNGEYRVSTEFSFAHGRPYEDVALDWTFLPDSAGYPDMAKTYRRHRLEAGEVKPIRERLVDQSDLAYIATSIEVRLRLSWKPAPSPVLEQNEFNEPPLTVAMTFDRARDFIAACRAADIGPAEFCLVGWKFRGHDGRYPQIWPIEPQLGGEPALRRLVAFAQESGYRIVVHNNHSDAYSVADCFDFADICKRANGLPVSNKGDKYIWSGGVTYKLCPQRAWERFVLKDLGKISALGFRGLHYIDVLTIGRPVVCHDPRHPCNQRDSARYIGRTLALARKLMGGSASEGPYDFCAGDYDFCLYASYADPAGKKLPPLVTRMVPMWQLVYHGIILAMPFAACTNYTIKPNSSRLSMVEYGGRPLFYLYSDYMTGLQWMGHEDLVAGTAAEMAESVAKIRQGAEEYAKLSDLQFEFIEDHCLLAPGVARTVYANGAETVVNRTERPFVYRGTTIEAGGWRRF
jgi:hypothetical protein